MAFVRPGARILERSITSGSGPLALAGAVDGSYNAFSAFMADGDTTYITAVEPGVAFWTGIGTYAASANTMTLTTVEETKGTFGSGTKEVMSCALASTATFREDIAGAIVTGGTSTAYTVASYRKYDSLARLDGNMIAFTANPTNGAGVTLNVDGLGAFPLVTAIGSPVPAGALVVGNIYVVTFIGAASVFKLQSFYSVQTAAIAAKAVTYAKIQNETASTLLGNPTGSAAVPSEITLGTGLAFSGSSLEAIGVESIAGNAGAFTLGGGITNNANEIELALNSATLQVSPSNPASTTSASAVFMGLGASCHITPVYSRRVLLKFTGYVGGGGINTNTTYQAKYGTGTAPTNGTSASGVGTAIGPSILQFTPSGETSLLDAGGIITGLTPGTAYWFDLTLFTGTAAGVLQNVGCTAMEF